MKVLIIVIVSLAAATGLAFLIGAHYRRAAQPEATAVRVELVVRGDLIEVVESPGEIQPLKKVAISAKVAAPIVELPHKEGETVYGPGPTTQPSLLVRLEDKDLTALKRSAMARLNAQIEQINVARQRIEAQRATIRSNRAMLADVERDFKRQQELVKTRDVSQSVADTAQAKYQEQFESIASAEQNLMADQTNLKVMEHEKEAAAAEVAKADEDISYTVITSPIDGTLTSLKAEVGEMVVTGTMNNPGTMILEVADLSKMLMIAHVDESQIDAVKVGQKVTVRIPAYRDQVFNGTVYTVAETRSEDKTDQTKYFEVKILLDLKGRRIRSGLSADADIETQSHPRVLRIPSQSVVGRPMDQLPAEVRNSAPIDKSKSIATVVFRCIDGKAVLTPVSVGASDDTQTLISDGLKEGDPVIVGPYKVLESLQNGASVKREDSAPTTQPGAAKPGK